MSRIEHHLLNMYVITAYLLRLRKHQYLKRSINFCVKVGRNHRRDVNHLTFLQNSKKCLGTLSIDKFSFRISTRRIILVVEGRRVARIWKGGGYYKRVRKVQTTLTRIFIVLESVSHGLSGNSDEISRNVWKFEGFFRPKSGGLH